MKPFVLALSLLAAAGGQAVALDYPMRPVHWIVPYPPGARIGQRVVRAARARGVILRPLGNVIVLMPPLAIAPAELERLLDVAREAIEEVTGA